MNLSKHPTANELVNLPQSVDDLAGGLNHDVRMAEQYAKWKNTEAKELRRMEEDVGRLEAKSEELNKDKERLRKKLDYTRQELDHTRQELDQTCEHLVSSQEKYTAMEKELERVRKDLLATQAQLDERSMSGASQEQEHAQRLKLLDKLREVNKENLNLQKQLAGSMTSNMAKMTDPVANYRLRGIGPKNQLTGTDPTAYAPWK